MSTELREDQRVSHRTYADQGGTVLRFENVGGVQCPVVKWDSGYVALEHPGLLGAMSTGEVATP